RLGTLDNGFWQTRQPGDLNAVALVRSAGEDLVKEDDFLIPFPNSDVVVGDGCLGVGEIGELVIVRGKKGAAADAIVQMLGDGPGDGQSVEGGGAAADFIEDDE